MKSGCYFLTLPTFSPLFPPPFYWGINTLTKGRTRFQEQKDSVISFMVTSFTSKCYDQLTGDHQYVFRTRVTIKLDMGSERNYIIQKVKEWSVVLTNHPYHPSQVNWITQIVVLTIVKFSAALAQWDDLSIRQLDTVIRQTQWKAWKLPPGCPDLVFWTCEGHRSLTYPNSKTIIIKEETGLLYQCTTLDDDHERMVRWDMQNTVLRWG
jgi:hypothetical protein